MAVNPGSCPLGRVRRASVYLLRLALGADRLQGPLQVGQGETAIGGGRRAIAGQRPLQHVRLHVSATTGVPCVTATSLAAADWNIR